MNILRPVCLFTSQSLFFVKILYLGGKQGAGENSVCARIVRNLTGFRSVVCAGRLYGNRSTTYINVPVNDWAPVNFVCGYTGKSKKARSNC